jgi:hypothetical protein
MLKTNLLLIILGTLTGFLSIEMLLYFNNYTTISQIRDLSPGKYNQDLKIGWVHRPGKYLFKSVEDNNTDPITVTYWDNGHRASRPNQDKAGKLILLVGCSFIEGYGLSDNDTIAWNLQSLRSDLKVENLGVNGYGTLHVYLTLKEHLRHTKESDITVVYGYANFHKYRNIKNPMIQKSLTNNEIFPYCNLKTCATWKGQGYNQILSSSRVYNAMMNIYETIIMNGKEDETIAIENKLISKLVKLAKNHKAKLIIAPVDLEPIHILKNIEDNLILCKDPILSDKNSYFADGHPNARWTKSFAMCLSKIL